MAVPLEQFVKHLEDSGILAGDTLNEFIPPRASPKDAEELARELVRQKKLTKYQAEAVYQGNGKSLVLDNYVLQEKIGEGGMGQVFKAEHRRMHRIVAVKVLPTSMMKNVATVARFQREVQAAARINHPNIVTAFDAGRDGGVHFLVMEYVEARDLAAIVKTNGPFPAEQAVNFILQAARGLEAAHAQGIVHRDIKPANLLVDKEGTVKILDLGLARLSADNDSGQEADLTNTGTIMGTVDYMSPEQALDTKSVDERADIYSLGCSLFYLLTGKAMYQGDTLMKKLLAHRELPIPSLRAVRREVSEQVEVIFSRMVAKNVEDRYQSMTDVISDLERCSTGKAASFDTRQLFSSSTDVGLTNFRKDISHSDAQPGLRKKPVGRSFGKDQKKLLLIGGGILGILALLAGLVSSLRTKERKQPITATLVPREDMTAVPGAKTPLDFETSPFKTWMAGVAILPAEHQVEMVARKLQELNPGFDGKVTHTIDFLDVTELQFLTDYVTDISPVRALAKLKQLKCDGSGLGKGKLADLTPLRGMGLLGLEINFTQVSDLSLLKGLPLTHLRCDSTPVSDLSPLKGIPLTHLDLGITQVSDLSPLLGMPLTHLTCSNTKVTDLSPLKGMKLTYFNCGGSQVFDLSPLQGMPLATLQVHDTSISDLSPLLGMPLTHLTCSSTKVTDLSPLKGMKLTYFNCGGSQVFDLSPLQAMPLTTLEFHITKVSDLSPLQGMPLTSLTCHTTKVSDLSPLKGMKLTMLYCSDTMVTDLSPLKGMPLGILNADRLQVSDLSPLRGMPLGSLSLNNCKQVFDLSPLQGMPLTYLHLCGTSATATGVAALKKMFPNCDIQWDDPVPAP